MVNAGNDTLAVASDTEITMFPEVPTSASVGVPVRRPVVVLNAAQDGMPSMRNVSVLPSGSDAVGWKRYAVPSVSEVSGVPLMFGGRLAGAFTRIVNAGSETV